VWLAGYYPVVLNRFEKVFDFFVGKIELIQQLHYQFGTRLDFRRIVDDFLTGGNRLQAEKLLGISRPKSEKIDSYTQHS
jgi:hypothetical protein